MTWHAGPHRVPPSCGPSPASPPAVASGRPPPHAPAHPPNHPLPCSSDKQKTDEIANLSRARGNPGARAMRVGPAAAKQLLDLLRCADPDVRVREGGDAAGAEGEAG